MTIRHNYTRYFKDRAIGLMSRVFNDCLGDQGSILGQVIPKTQKMVFDATLLNTQHYKVSIKGKVEQSREGVVPFAIPQCSSCWKGAFRIPSTRVADLFPKIWYHFTYTGYFRETDINLKFKDLTNSFSNDFKFLQHVQKQLRSLCLMF